MEWQVAFDLKEEGFRDWSISAIGLAFVLFGLLLVLKGDLLTEAKFNPFDLRERKNKYFRIFSWFFFLFSLLWTVLAFGGTYSEYYLLERAYQTGNYTVMEGHIENFDPMPYSG